MKKLTEKENEEFLNKVAQDERDRKSQIIRENNANRDEADAKREKFCNEYMNQFWAKLEAMTRKEIISCAFACGRMSIPGGDLCPECQNNYDGYMDIKDPDECRSERVQEDENFK